MSRPHPYGSPELHPGLQQPARRRQTGGALNVFVIALDVIVFLIGVRLYVLAVVDFAYDVAHPAQVHSQLGA